MITIFTPTYNRAYILPRLYDSLKTQTVKDFEWIIVDDGSRDETEQLVAKWIQETKDFPIKYFKTANKGKHCAINYGVQKARGELFFIVDSDDTLPPDAAENILEIYSEIKHDNKFIGVCGLRADPVSKNPFGNFGKMQKINCSAIDIREKYKIRGDMAEVFKTEILRKYAFPELTGENFCTEALVWNRIAKEHIFCYFNKTIYFCEYRADGLTASIRKRHRQNPLATMLWLREIIDSKEFSFITKIRAALLYWRYTAFYYGKRDKSTRPLLWMYLFLPFGMLLFLYDIIMGSYK